MYTLCGDDVRAHLVMELAVDWLAIFVHQLEGVGAIAIHVTVAIRDASITEQEGHRVWWWWWWWWGKGGGETQVYTGHVSVVPEMDDSLYQIPGGNV